MLTKTQEAVLPASSADTVKRNFKRLNSIDLLRGLVMIIMALDHTRDFFHKSNINPLDLTQTTPELFFTRWITHFCAPVFVFLSGASIYLQGLRKTKPELSLFLLKRGLWLIMVEIVIMSFIFSFDIHYSFFFFQVIWTIGISMVILGLLVRLPYTALFAIGAFIVVAHNSLDFLEAKHVGSFDFLWNLGHRSSVYTVWPHHTLIILYPFLPWTGLMLLGYCFGKLYSPDVDKEYRRKFLLYTGFGLLAFFVLLRMTDLYGDPDPWSRQQTLTYTILSFINVHKYPPSLLYMCLTIGPAMIFLAVTEDANTMLSRAITVYGRVPFFYYILHFFLIHTLCMALFLTRGHTLAEGSKGVPFKFVINGEGYRLWFVYVIWFAVVAILYPLCKWYSDYKSTHRKWWLSYI